MATETLRELSRQWAAGEIDRETYRRQRHALIEAVVGGARPLVPYLAPEPPQPTVFPYDEDDGDTTQEIIAPMVAAAARAQTAGKRRHWPWIVAVIGLALAAAGARWLLDGAREPVDEAAAPAATAHPAPTPRADLLEAFLADRSWSSARLLELANAWHALPAEQRTALRAGDSMRRFTDALLVELAGERALAELGDTAHALARQEELLMLARALGIDDGRVTRAVEALGAARAEPAGTDTRAE